MLKTLDVSKIIANSPTIDEREFQKTKEMLEKAKKSLVVKATEYNILSPFIIHTKIKVLDKTDDDETRCAHVLL